MCGLTGFIRRNGLERTDQDVIRVMTATLQHRGPDSQDTWTDAEAGVALGHVRLAIQDLAPTGAQPMTSPSGRYVMVYNGEIYATQNMRSDLEAKGVTFRGHSDTEVMLAGFEAWGLKATLDQAIGMFAMAIWDRETRNLTLVRDRLGIKPLYWAFGTFGVIFGSELKSVRAHPACPTALSPAALGQYLHWMAVPAPLSIYDGVHHVPPGHMVTIPTPLPDTAPEPEPFWSLEAVQKEATLLPTDLEDTAVIDQAEALLTTAVQDRLVSDVPLGALLSGGLDSSTVTALMQHVSATPIRTFSIGFDQAEFDESSTAEAIAQHLGTQHTTLRVTAQDALDVIPLLPDMYDEPFADSSQIPTYLVSKLTRDHLTVALSGDGGDEVFGGYNRYTSLEKLQKLWRLPQGVRSLAQAGLNHPSPATWQAMTHSIPGLNRIPEVGDKLHKLAAAIGAGPEGYYAAMTGQIQNPQTFLTADLRHQALSGPTFGNAPDLLTQLQLNDLHSYVPTDVLTKVDRASMAVALEVRVPLLDHRVVSFGLRLRPHHKIRQGKGKWLLREILKRHVPDHLFDRPKQGFGVPLADWLRGPLKDWAGDMVAPDHINKFGVLNPKAVNTLWTQHQAGTHNHQHQLWTLIMLQSWLNRWA